MLTYVHELPADAQREGVTHVEVGRTIIDSHMLHAKVTYGTLTDGEFQPDDLAGTHKLVVPDMGVFLQSGSGIDTLPGTTEDLLQQCAAGLCRYADAQDLWHTTQ